MYPLLNFNYLKSHLSMLHSSSRMALLGKGHRQGRKSSLIPVWAPVQTTLSTAQALKYWLFLIFSFPIRTSLCTALAQWWSLLLRASIKFKKLFPKLLSKKSHLFSQAALWSWWFFSHPCNPKLENIPVCLIKLRLSWHDEFEMCCYPMCPVIADLGRFHKGRSCQLQGKKLKFYEHLINLKTWELYELPSNWCALQTEPVKISGWAGLEDERWHFSSCWFEMMLQEKIKNSAWSLPVFKNDTMS